LRSEFFRANHGHEQVDDESQSDDADDAIFQVHGLELSTGVGVKNAQGKESQADQNEDGVLQAVLLSSQKPGVPGGTTLFNRGAGPARTAKMASTTRTARSAG
jgi:hypothetical protein